MVTYLYILVAAYKNFAISLINPLEYFAFSWKIGYKHFANSWYDIFENRKKMCPCVLSLKMEDRYIVCIKDLRY